ncbi:unnamed protein product [Allacma fusca]|uniref:Dehydrogenase/reductase SDR family member 7 n=1 Tax=Allacma fusca TaxID=39272 RepID=A0A8J2P4X1_9HEXA|nr:unnamed protein product [Allacma fusca]
MGLIYLFGLLVLLFSVACIILALLADSDIVTYLYARYGKQPETEFKNKVVWITGASSGIGEAIAKNLVKVGAKVVLSARRKEELERVKQECLTSSKAKESDILVLPLDVTNFESHESALKTVLDKFGKLDIFISNAGQGQGQDNFVEMEMVQDRHIFELNVFSVVNMNRLVVKYFLKNGGGHVAVVSSVAGRFPGPSGSSYTASKHALHGYFNSLRMETYGKKIDVTLICPGPVATPIFEKGVTKTPGKLSTIKLDGVPMMTPERCAHLALVSMANKLNESWIARLPIIPFSYLVTYFPLVSEPINKMIASRFAK